MVYADSRAVVAAASVLIELVSHAPTKDVGSEARRVWNTGSGIDLSTGKKACSFDCLMNVVSEQQIEPDRQDVVPSLQPTTTTSAVISYITTRRLLSLTNPFVNYC
jgi:hypothetical protein